MVNAARQRAIVALIVVWVTALLGCADADSEPAPSAQEQAAPDQQSDVLTWIEAGKLAGSPAPEKTAGGVAAWLDEIAQQTDAPVAVLNLRATADPEFGKPVAATGHVPIPDFQPPTTEQALAALDFIQQQQAAGRVVIVHCQGGCGRTGTIVALFLRHTKGLSGEAAIARVRELNACFIETAGQEAFVRDFDPALL